MTFAITPITGFPAEEQAEFPAYLQWQWDNVNAGDRRVAVVNFTGDGITVTRGTGEQSNVITVRKVAAPPPPPPSNSIGWLDPADDSGGTAAAANAGSRSIETTPFVENQILYAGVVGYAGQTVVWALDYQTTNFADAPPVLTDIGGGKARLSWPNIDYPVNRFYDTGLATISATINGSPATNEIEAGIADFAYGDIAWSQVP